MLYHIVTDRDQIVTDRDQDNDTTTVNVVNVDTLEEARVEACRIASLTRLGERVRVVGDEVEYVRVVTRGGIEVIRRPHASAVVNVPDPVATSHSPQTPVFKPGDVVGLMCGGPRMVVQQIVSCCVDSIDPAFDVESEQPRERLLCSWFRPSGKVNYGLFDPASVLKLQRLPDGTWKKKGEA